MPPSPFRTWPQAIAAVVTVTAIMVLWVWLLAGGACQVHGWLFDDPRCY